jgi:transcriptional regulator with XRE-family HTH domain
MILQRLGRAVRQARLARGLTQAQLAEAAGLSRNTLNRLEAGVFPDLGVRKAQAILEELGMELAIKPARGAAAQADFAAMASASASVSLREKLTAEELAQALRSGKATPGKEAHFIALLEEAPAELLKGLAAQLGASAKPGTVAKNLHKIAEQVGITSHAWRNKLG